MLFDMKKIYWFLLSCVLIFQINCNTLKYALSDGDANAAIKELLSIGTSYGGDLLSKRGTFNKETILQSILPADAAKVLQTLQTLGLGGEVTRFTNTLTTVAQKSAEKSVPIFLAGIKNMGIKNAIGIVKNGGSSATDYLRKTIGDTLRQAIKPAVSNALGEYKLDTQFNELAAPIKLFAGNSLNIDLSSLLSGLIANAMFNKIEEKEIEIRTRASARKTALLQKVFGQVVTK